MLKNQTRIRQPRIHKNSASVALLSGKKLILHHIQDWLLFQSALIVTGDVFRVQLLTDLKLAVKSLEVLEPL